MKILMLLLITGCSFFEKEEAVIEEEPAVEEESRADWDDKYLVDIEEFLDMMILRNPKPSSLKCAKEYAGIFKKYNKDVSVGIWEELILSCEKMKDSGSNDIISK